jgi:hypothetical protein
MSYDKFDLRRACKLRGITGASAMTNLVMEQALGLPTRDEGNDAIEAALQAILKSKPAAAAPADAAPKAPKAPKAPREPKVRVPSADSIKAYLQGVFASEGRVNIKDAIAHAAKTGRSKITVYVQAKQIGLSAARAGTDPDNKGFFVKKA